MAFVHTHVRHHRQHTGGAVFERSKGMHLRGPVMRRQHTLHDEVGEVAKKVEDLAIAHSGGSAHKGLRGKGAVEDAQAIANEFWRKDLTGSGTSAHHSKKSHSKKKTHFV